MTENARHKIAGLKKNNAMLSVPSTVPLAVFLVKLGD